MKRILLGCFLLANVARAESVVISADGRTFHTGFLGRPATTEKPLYWAPEATDDLPDHFDSRELNFVAPIKDQGPCGSCWDFSMTKTFESARLSAGESYLDLAEQDMLVNDKKAYGCEGGFMDAHYLVDHGLALESDCPYKANDGIRCNKPVASKAMKWGFVGAEGRAPTTDELRAAVVKYHVISVTVAAGNGFVNPRSDGSLVCGDSGINHMINIIGYDKVGSSVKFIIANSWGDRWGDHGFAKGAQGCDQLASTEDSALWIEYR